jgi:hypothetical protein
VARDGAAKKNGAAGIQPAAPFRGISWRYDENNTP